MENDMIITNTKSIKEIVKVALKEQLIEFSQWLEGKLVNNNIILTREQTAKMLSISLSTLNRWTRDKKIISYGIEGRVYYKMNDIHNSLSIINQ